MLISSVAEHMALWTIERLIGMLGVAMRRDLSSKVQRHVAQHEVMVKLCQHKKRTRATATTRKSPGQICVSPAEKQRNDTKRGRSHTKQKTRKSMRIASRHDGVNPTVSAGPNKLKEAEKRSNCKNRQHGCEKLMYTSGGHLRVLSGVRQRFW